MGFSEELRKLSQPRPIQRHPLVELMHQARFGQHELLQLAAKLSYMAHQFPQNLSRVLANCDHRTTRRHLLENLLEEEGFSAVDGKLLDRPTQAHAALIQKFVLACERVTGQMVPQIQLESSWFEMEIQQKRWIGPCAYFMVGMEYNVPPTFAAMIPHLRQGFGFEQSDLAYFSEHLTADVAHGEQGIQLMLDACQSEDQRIQARQGAKRGALAWWHFWRRLPQSSHAPT